MNANSKVWNALSLLRRLGPASRMALGLVGLTIMLLLMSDLLFRGFLGDPVEQATRERRLTVQLLATQVVHALQSPGDEALRAVLRTTLRSQPSMRSIAVVPVTGAPVIAGPHARRWSLLPGAPGTVDQLRVGLLAGGAPWGELQVSFDPAAPGGAFGLLQQPMVRGIALMAGLGFVAFYLYLRRALVVLDPSQVVPDRVRSALDTLSEGVLVLDSRQTVMLANRTLQDWLPAKADPIGRPVSSLGWLVDAAEALDGGAPWRAALQYSRPQLGARLQLTINGSLRHMILNCSPIQEGGGSARGCLLTLTDVSELEERTERLRAAMVELEASKEEIRRKNEELVTLATRDPLTGCLNRRAFSAESTPLLEAAVREGRAMSLVMCDIDHFKRVNDTYGHAGGDLVLQSASKTLARGLRAGDLLARFGGEEFCILLVDTTLEQAREIAERLRADIEAGAGQALRQYDNVRVTMSFGVEQVGLRETRTDAIIDFADQALYHSKKSGRNRVTTYDELLALPLAVAAEVAAVPATAA